MMTDPIADMLTRIRNANMRRKKKTHVPYSKLKEAILDVMKREGFIANYRVLEPRNFAYKILEVHLKYDEEGNPVITQLKRESKPGRRVYKSVDEIKKVLNGFGIGIYSTSQGVLSDRECRMKRVGGEYICSIW